MLPYVALCCPMLPYVALWCPMLPYVDQLCPMLLFLLLSFIEHFLSHTIYMNMHNMTIGSSVSTQVAGQGISFCFLPRKACFRSLLRIASDSWWWIVISANVWLEIAWDGCRWLVIDLNWDGCRWFGIAANGLGWLQMAINEISEQKILDAMEFGEIVWNK